MANSKRVLVIDDDDFMRSMLVEQLPELEGYACVGAATGNEGIKLGAEEYFDLVLLDVGLPDISGIEVCKALRAQGLLAPIVMLTAADDETDTITGLDAGATDYITKPFKLGVLLARLRAHIRQFEMSDEAMLHIGPFGFQPGQRTLIEIGSEPGSERTVRLTDKESQILKFLYLQGGQPVSRKDLLGEVWGYNAQVTTHTLETHVYRLRQKIERDPTNAEILLTDRGGYRLAT
ncbi:MAG: response regulator transcription factor [Rhodospirillaceae bacterium]|nr:response regulator transcription factor [Rhodospirillaceae bacterium]